MSRTPAHWPLGLIAVAALLGLLSHPVFSAAQYYGLDAPPPLGPYLDGVFPTLAPQAPGSSTCEVVDAWIVEDSCDGTTWVTAGSFSHSLAA